MAKPETAVPQLVVTAPPDRAGQVFTLSLDELVVGHSDTADIILDDKFVSRRHALVTVGPAGSVTIRDLNSTGGTFVNDERLEGPRVLLPGDIVRFADLSARFDPGSSEEEAAAAYHEPPTRALPVLAGTGPSTTTPAPFEPGETYTVTGTVRSPALPGIAGLTVQLADKNVGGQQVLASTQTAGDGSYSFGQVISGRYLADHHKTSPDLQVQVLAGGTVLAASEVSYSTPAAVTLDVVLPASAAGLPSEYETVTASLAAAYPGSLSALREDSSQQDITYLANKTGWDARAVALTALAHQFSQLTAPPRAVDGDAARTAAWPVHAAGIQPEFYYALFRAGLPASPDSLFQASPATVRAIWEQAVAGGVIPPALAKEVPSAVTRFQAISAARSLDAPPPAGISTLREMISVTLPEARQQEQFAQLYARYQGDWAGLWDAAGQAFGSEATTRLQVTGQLLYLTVNNQPLVAALQAAENDAPLASPLDLVGRGTTTRPGGRR